MSEKLKEQFGRRKCVSNTNCCVYGCNSVKKRNPNLKFHLFPKKGEKVEIINDINRKITVDRRSLWETRLKMEKKVSNAVSVCSLHFDEKDYSCSGWSSRTRLMPSAIPSKNLPQRSFQHKEVNKLRKQHRLERVGTRRQILFSQTTEARVKKRPFSITFLRLKKESQAQASTSAATSSTVPKEEVLGTSIEQGVSNSFQISFPRNKKRKAPVKPFEIEFLPHFDPDAEKTETESQLREIKHEVNTEDYETFSQASFGPQYVKTEPLPEDPGCSSYTDTVLSSSEAKSSLTIKTECDDSEFDIEGRQYAEDLKSLLPEQRILVRKFVANIMSRAKMNLLTLDYLQEF